MSSSALLLLLPLLPLAVAQYVCDGDSCCDWECYGNEWECCENPSALGPRSIRCWWPTAAAGFVTCEDKVKSNYDISIKCSEALQAYQSCGLDSAHACGYGLACVAQTITYAECRPLCGDTAPKSFYRSILSAGCSNDGQTGTLNTDAGVTYMLPPQREKCQISSLVPIYGFNRENDVTVYGEYQLYALLQALMCSLGQSGKWAVYHTLCVLMESIWFTWMTLALLPNKNHTFSTEQTTAPSLPATTARLHTLAMMGHRGKKSTAGDHRRDRHQRLKLLKRMT
jgi:hypothetical protein